MMSGHNYTRRHVVRTKLDIDRSQNEAVRARMFGVLKMKRKGKKHPQSSIRRFFNGRRQFSLEKMQLRIIKKTVL